MQRTAQKIQSVIYPAILASFKPSSFILSEILEEHLTPNDILTLQHKTVLLFC
jgi:hypothetical protein